jgi:hypothetical protein
LGVDGDARVGISEGEGEVLAGASGFLSPFDAKRKGQTEKVFEDPSMTREISSRSLPTLGRFAKRMR